MRKAKRAITSASLLLDAGDVDGVTNRAYYAMFDAAKAALQRTRGAAGYEGIKTHSGLIAAFSREFVKNGQLSADVGRTLNRVAEIRLVADYTGDGVAPDKAEWAVEQARLFIQAAKHLR